MPCTKCFPFGRALTYLSTCNFFLSCAWQIAWRLVENHESWYVMFKKYSPLAHLVWGCRWAGLGLVCIITERRSGCCSENGNCLQQVPWTQAHADTWTASLGSGSKTTTAHGVRGDIQSNWFWMSVFCLFYSINMWAGKDCEIMLTPFSSHLGEFQYSIHDFS